jgi:hypothetical protein
MSPQPRFAPHHPATGRFYVVTRDYGRLGRESVSDPEWTANSIVRDIAAGQLDRVSQVLVLEDGVYADITDDIREAVEAQRVAA